MPHRRHAAPLTDDGEASVSEVFHRPDEIMLTVVAKVFLDTFKRREIAQARTAAGIATVAATTRRLRLRFIWHRCPFGRRLG